MSNEIECLEYGLPLEDNWLQEEVDISNKGIEPINLLANFLSNATEDNESTWTEEDVEFLRATHFPESMTPLAQQSQKAPNSLILQSYTDIPTASDAHLKLTHTQAVGFWKQLSIALQARA